MRMMTENFVFYKEAEHFSRVFLSKRQFMAQICTHSILSRHFHSITILLEIPWAYWSCG